MVIVPLWLAFTPLFLARPIVTIKGDTGCPTRQEVAARLGSVLPVASAMREADVAELEDDAARLRVTLRRADGNLIGRRLLQRSFSCADLAAAVSVVIGAWESDVHPEFKLDVPPGWLPRPTAPVQPLSSGVPSEPPSRSLKGSPAPVSSSLPALALSPVSVQPPVLDRPRAPATSSSGPLVVSEPVVVSAPLRRTAMATPPSTEQVPPRLAVVATPARAPTSQVGGVTPSRAAIDLGAAIFGVLAPGGDAANSGAAAGGLLTVGWTPAENAENGEIGWGAHLGLWGTTERSTLLPSGTARWRRFAVMAGPHRRFVVGSRRSVLELHAEVLGGLLAIHGAGFAANLSDSNLDPGFGAGARVTVGRGHVRPWADLAITGWLFPHVVYERPLDYSATLPRFEGRLALGVSLWMGGY